MVSRYWGVLFAAIALAVVASGTGGFVVAMHQPQEQRYQRYRAGAEKTDGAPSTLTYRSPCVDPRGKEESDLCAQWRAASASEQSAFWALCSVVVTLLGTAGLLVTILQGRRVLRQSLEANEISQNIGEAQARSYLSAPRLDFHVDRLPRDHEGFPKFELDLHLHNSGQTPAVNVSYYCSAEVCKARENSLPSLETIEHHYFVNNVMPGDPIKIRPMCFGLAIKWRDLLSRWNLVDGDTVFGEMPALKIYGVIFYEDVFQKTYRSAFCFVFHEFVTSKGPSGSDDLQPIQDRIPMFEPVRDRLKFLQHQ